MPGGGQSQIPAGFTYLGQFIDHDLTFDKTNVMLGDERLAGAAAPGALAEPRPRLALRRRARRIPSRRKFYEADGLHLKMGKTVGGRAASRPRTASTSRAAPGNTAAKKRKAIIPDPRNDENLAVAQTHLAMIRFHNRVVDTLPASVPPAQRFAKAREIVTKHYQWMLRTDYLPRICAPGVVNDVFNNGRKAFEVGATPTDVPTMPIEFSVAALPARALDGPRAPTTGTRSSTTAPAPSTACSSSRPASGDLGGEPRLPSNWIADFRRLYDFGEANKPNLVVPASKFNRAMRIDTTLVDPLQHLPPAASAARSCRQGPARNLAFRNLTRAKMVKLATGQQMATFLKSKGVNADQADQRADPRRQRRRRARRAHRRPSATALLKDTPLWFYILREAELNDGQAEGRRRADRRRDLPPRDGGQPALDRPRPGFAPDARARTTRPSGWSTCCSSPSRARRALLNPNG